MNVKGNCNDNQFKKSGEAGHLTGPKEKKKPSLFWQKKKDH